MVKQICAIACAYLLFGSIPALAGPSDDRWAYSGLEENVDNRTLSASGELFPEAHFIEEQGYSIYFKSDSGETYEVVNSPEINKLLEKEEKTFAVRIDGELTPEFLFWGGNLVIKSFSILGKKPAPQHVVSATTEWLDRDRVR